MVATRRVAPAIVLCMTNTFTRFALALTVPAAMIAGCTETAPDAPPPTAQDEFFAALATHCGKAYAGELVSEDPADADFVGAEMVMHVSECSEDRIAVPFHVKLDGQEWDRSRTWVITRTSIPHMNGNGRTQTGLRLKHDHRHEDGTSDAVTMYGGDTVPSDDGAGTARIQSFPVDAESIEMFGREGLTASVTNVWSVEVDPAGTEGARYIYQLKRTAEGGAPEDRLFRVEFDLTNEVEAPPAAWGWE